MILKKSLLSMGLILVLISCQQTPQKVEHALKLAGNNRTELEKVIQHYRAKKDSLKLKAAYFLIQNMTTKFSQEGEQLKRFSSIFSEIEKARSKIEFKKGDAGANPPIVDTIWNEFVEKYGETNQFNLEIKPDLYCIKSDYLIQNIEYAFKAWSLPWCRHLKFEAFCEYILPYRFFDESLIAWRPMIYKKYKPLLDSLKKSKVKDPVKVCRLINKKLSSQWIYSTTVGKYPVAMTAYELITANMGICDDQSALALFTMRALGVPIVSEEIPHYGNRSLGHVFNAVLNKKGSFVNFEVGVDQLGSVVHEREKNKCYIPKVYRINYAASEDALTVVKGQDEEIPPCFANPGIVDVTSIYLPVKKIKIMLTEEAPENCNHVYLCVFNNTDWKVISWAKIEDNEASFENMGVGKDGLVYYPVYYKNNQLLPATYPFQVDVNGKVIPIKPIKREQKLHLIKTYHYGKWMLDIAIKTKFQASNSPDFKNAVDLYTIKDSIELTPRTLVINEKNSYRYVRYLFPIGSAGNVSEVSFRSKNGSPLKGKSIVSKNIFIKSDVENAFDDDLHTFVGIAIDTDQHWIGLDFGAKKKISNLYYCPKRSKHDVWPGMRYELFYWDGEWKSLGIKKAISYEVEFQSPISNALFLLKCLDGGESQRIFTYEKGKQIWW